MILHGIRRWFEIRGELKAGGHRVSRHYYDLHQLVHSPVGDTAVADTALGADCVSHARMFFNRPAFDLESAHAPSFVLVPQGEMRDVLRRDYAAMSGMIFGEPPNFDAIIESIESLETAINAA